MPSYEIQVQGGEDIVKWLEQMGRDIELGTEGLLDSAADEARDRLESASPSFQGYLKSSFEVEVTGDNERTIGAGNAGPSSEFPTSRYVGYVEEGGGPSGKLPNVEDVALRLGLSTRDAFAFARYLNRSGKAVRQGNFFVRETAMAIGELFNAQVSSFLARVTS